MTLELTEEGENSFEKLSSDFLGNAYTHNIMHTDTVKFIFFVNRPLLFTTNS